MVSTCSDCGEDDRAFDRNAGALMDYVASLEDPGRLEDETGPGLRCGTGRRCLPAG